MANKANSTKANEPKESVDVLALVLDAATDRKASDTVFLDLTGVVDYLDVLCITSGETEIQNRAVCDRIAERLKECDIIFDSLQGYRDGSWIVLDYSWLVVHVMLPRVRSFYRLEELWSEGKIVDI